jgi:hypothetical protein
VHGFEPQTTVVFRHCYEDVKFGMREMKETHISLDTLIFCKCKVVRKLLISYISTSYTASNNI